MEHQEPCTACLDCRGRKLNQCKRTVVSVKSCCQKKNTAFAHELKSCPKLIWLIKSTRKSRNSAENWILKKGCLAGYFKEEVQDQLIASKEQWQTDQKKKNQMMFSTNSLNLFIFQGKSSYPLYGLNPNLALLLFRFEHIHDLILSCYRFYLIKL